MRMSVQLSQQKGGCLCVGVQHPLRCSWRDEQMHLVASSESTSATCFRRKVSCSKWSFSRAVSHWSSCAMRSPSPATPGSKLILLLFPVGECSRKQKHVPRREHAQTHTLSLPGGPWVDAASSKLAAPQLG